jgi:hypothetical protein
MRTTIDDGKLKQRRIARSWESGRRRAVEPGKRKLNLLALLTRFHVHAENGINSGLIAGAMGFIPFKNIRIESNRNTRFGCRHSQLSIFKESVIEFGNIRVIYL